MVFSRFVCQSVQYGVLVFRKLPPVFAVYNDLNNDLNVGNFCFDSLYIAFKVDNPFWFFLFLICASLYGCLQNMAILEMVQLISGGEMFSIDSRSVLVISLAFLSIVTSIILFAFLLM